MPSTERLTATESEGEGNAAGHSKSEAVAAAAQARLLKVFAIAVSENLTDQLTAGEYVQTDRRFLMIGVLRPTFDSPRRYPIKKAAHIARPRPRIVWCYSCAPRETLPDHFKLIALIEPRRAISRADGAAFA